jgi:hypothetical protein
MFIDRRGWDHLPAIAEGRHSIAFGAENIIRSLDYREPEYGFYVRLALKAAGVDTVTPLDKEIERKVKRNVIVALGSAAAGLSNGSMIKLSPMRDLKLMAEVVDLGPEEIEHEAIRYLEENTQRSSNSLDVVAHAYRGIDHVGKIVTSLFNGDAHPKNEI